MDILGVNDSLVKKQGSEDFKIYRKNGYGKWQEMLFK
jgi:hypothetical protein